MRTIVIILATLVIAGCAAPNYRGGKAGVPFHDDPDIKLVEGIIQLKYFVVEEAINDGADLDALHDLSKSIPRFWISFGNKKGKYTPLGALLRTSSSSDPTRRLYEEQQYIEILRLLLDYGVDPNSRLGQRGDEDIFVEVFGAYSFLRGPSATIGIPYLYNNGLVLNKSLFETPSFNLSNLKTLRDKQSDFWADINAKHENVLAERLQSLTELYH